MVHGECRTIGETMGNKKISTKFGTASINNGGYYHITSRKEGNTNKKLHRLIYEDFWGVKLPEEIYVHHIDGDKLNNCILNLEAIHASDHQRMHNLGAKKSKESCDKISKKQSKNQNTSGYFRVSKLKTSSKQGFTWAYQYYVDGKRKNISSVDIVKLKEKVLAKGLEWIEY